MFVALSAGFASCSDDDDEKVDAANLVGTWQATYSEGWEQSGSEKDTWKGSWDITEDNSYMASIYTFTKDGKGVYKFEVIDTPFTWTLNGNKLSMTEEDEYEESGFYTTVATITSYSDTEMVVEASYSDKDHSYYEKTTYTRVK